MNLNVINSQVKVITNPNSNSNGLNLTTNGSAGQSIKLSTSGLFQGTVFSYAIGNLSSPFSLTQKLSYSNSKTTNVFSDGFSRVIEMVYIGNDTLLLLFGNSTLIQYNYITEF